MMDLPPAIETRGLSKRYKSTHALRGLDLRVPAGSIYGLVGRSGAGKTTTIKILMGLVHPTSGEGRVVGYRIDDVADGRRIRRGTAYVGEDRAMWPDMTVSEVLAVSRPFFPRWRTDLEREYLDTFEIPQQQRIGRLAVVLTQIAAFTLLPSLLLCAMAPLRGQHYPVADAVVHSGILFVAGQGLFGLTIVLRTMLADAAAYTAAAALVGLVGLFTFIVDDFTPYSIFRLMNGAEYFFNHRVPWSGLAVSATMGMAFIWLSMRIVEARDY